MWGEERELEGYGSHIGERSSVWVLSGIIIMVEYQVEKLRHGNITEINEWK